MSRQIKGFITNDEYIDNNTGVVAPLYELSPVGFTYAKEKQQYYSNQDALFSLYVFNQIDNVSLTQDEVNSIINVVKDFCTYATAYRTIAKQQLIVTFMSQFNLTYPTDNLTDITVTDLVDTGPLVGPDFIYFKVRNIECNIWLSDLSFRGFFPDYDIDIVLPFANLPSIIHNNVDMLDAIENFSFIEFNTRIETTKGKNPTTYVKTLNIPYHLPNSTVYRDCYFAFNQYGSQGNYDYILKLNLYEYLQSLGLTSQEVEDLFPSILQVNEFFITPRWMSIAVPSQVGQGAILSQISLAYDKVFDLNKYVKVFDDLQFLEDQSYNVPYDYNNILLVVSNGFYTEDTVKDFRVVYNDFMSITSTHPDFARMKAKTQRFITLLDNMLAISDSNTSLEMFTKMVDNENYQFNLINRKDAWYLSIFFEGHQYYMLPKFEYIRLT